MLAGAVASTIRARGGRRRHSAVAQRDLHSHL